MLDEQTNTLLARCDDGDAEALGTLIDHLFHELRRLAGHHFRTERAGHTLQPTALVSELYLRLVGGKLPARMSREHFFVVASRLMRQILVDHARARAARKRGGDRVRLSFDDAFGVPVVAAVEPERLMAVHEALERLAVIDAEQARLAELRYFGGLTLTEAAGVLEVSRATAERRWQAARRWLALTLREPARGQARRGETAPRG